MADAERTVVDPSTFKQGRRATPAEVAFLKAQWPQEKRRRWILQNCYFGHGHMEGKTQEQVMKGGIERIKTSYVCECGYTLVQYIPRSLLVTIIDEDCLPPPLVVDMH